MIVYPAIDLIGGNVVRLRQGRFDEVKSYSMTPLDALEKFALKGAEWAHVVDLDGARARKPVQHELIADLARSKNLRLQVAGGFSEREQLARMFDAGVERVVVGSLAVTQPHIVREWMDEFGIDRVALSLDVRLVGKVPLVAISGWTEDTGRSLWEIAAMYPEARHLVVTDIGRDGMLQGPNIGLYQEIARRLPSVQVQASGGVSSPADLMKLPTSGVIIGKALWEGRITIEEALGLARA